MQLNKRKPEEKQKMDNAFEGIRDEPWWRQWAEAAGATAAGITIVDLIIRLIRYLG
jgi:hypothetical protein